ncbi:MAG: hypothetical protein V3V29_03775 [Acidimicrobiia bacterium]
MNDSKTTVVTGDWVVPRDERGRPKELIIRNQWGGEKRIPDLMADGCGATERIIEAKIEAHVNAGELTIINDVLDDRVYLLTPHVDT